MPAIDNYPTQPANTYHVPPAEGKIQKTKKIRGRRVAIGAEPGGGL
jgi:hypothetical protein